MMKKYYSYLVNHNYKKEMEWLMEHAMTPLDHIFNDHHLCDSNWHHKKKFLDNDKIPVDP